MTCITPEQFRHQYAPVVLGAGRRGRRVARQLFATFGAATHMVDAHSSLWCRLTPWLSCHALPAHCSPALVLLALTDLASQIEQREKTPLLFICDSSLSHNVSEFLEELERHFLVVSDEKLHLLMKGVPHA